MHVISRDAPCYFLTSVAKGRLPVFKTEVIKVIACAALDEAKRSGAFALYAYVIMPDHLHVVTDPTLSPSRTLQFINGITSRRVIDYLKKNGHESSLLKLRHETRRHQYRFSLWDHHPDARLLFTETMLMQRVTYTHQNPVRGGLVDQPWDYRWSSVRFWSERTLDDEPLLMDLDRIKWRKGRNGFAPLAPHIAVSLRLTAESFIKDREAPPPFRGVASQSKYAMHGKSEAYRYVRRQRRNGPAKRRRY